MPKTESGIRDAKISEEMLSPEIGVPIARKKQSERRVSPNATIAHYETSGEIFSIPAGDDPSSQRTFDVANNLNSACASVTQSPFVLTCKTKGRYKVELRIIIIDNADLKGHVFALHLQNADEAVSFARKDRTGKFEMCVQAELYAAVDDVLHVVVRAENVAGGSRDVEIESGVLEVRRGVKKGAANRALVKAWLVIQFDVIYAYPLHFFRIVLVGVHFLTNAGEIVWLTVDNNPFDQWAVWIYHKAHQLTWECVLHWGMWRNFKYDPYAYKLVSVVCNIQLVYGQRLSL